MKHQQLLSDFRNELAVLTREVESSVAMGHFDINVICENVVCDLLKELYSLPALRSLNAEEKKNFPAIDLADDKARVAIQVTATTTLVKIKSTLSKFLKHKLNERYDRLIVYVLTSKQGSYSQAAVDKLLNKRFEFDTRENIWDYRDISAQAAGVKPQTLNSAFEALRSYTRGVAVGLAAEDFNPPDDPPESLALNTVEVYCPDTLYVADLLPEVAPNRGRVNRKSVRTALAEFGLVPPSDFEVRAKQLLTFHDLENNDNPFAKVIDGGTITPMSPYEFHSIDEDHDRTFKSMLRLLLQQQIYRHGVVWMHEDSLFVFYPREPGDDLRTEPWVGKRASARKVFERKMNKKDPSKVFSVKHLAFATQFLFLDDRWHLAITPNWYFSFGDSFRRSGFADKQLSGIKRLEKNRSVHDQFRFWADWLTRCDEKDLFSDRAQAGPALAFGNTTTIGGAPALDETLWEPLPDVDTDDVHPDFQTSFDSL